MAKPKTLEALVSAVALDLDRPALAAALASIAKGKRPKRKPPSSDWRAAERMAREARARTAVEAGAAGIANPFARKPRKPRAPAGKRDWRTVTLLATTTSSMAPRKGTKRFAKWLAVWEHVQDATFAEKTVRVWELVGRPYNAAGDTLDAHDINGMAERRLIKLED